MVNYAGSSDAWSDEAVADLRAMHRGGMSYGAIAKELTKRYRYPFTRNAVCGKVHRLGMVFTRPASPTLPKAPKPRRAGAAQLKEAVARTSAPAPEPEVKDGIHSWDRRNDGGAVDPLLRATRRLPRAEMRTGVFEPVDGSTPRPWLCRRSGECAWPIGEATGVDQLSCCQPTGDVRIAYCTAHQKVARDRAYTVSEEATLRRAKSKGSYSFKPRRKRASSY